jgi:outer membrane lipoprotein SlyB
MNSTTDNQITLRIPGLAIASVMMLGAVFVAGESLAQSTSVSYGRITAVRQVELQNQGAQATGALIGGLAGVASGSGQSGSNRALRGIGGAAAGRRLAGAAGSNTGFEYTVMIGNQTTRIVTDQSGLRVRDCVSVERGSFSNIRLAPDERCEAAQRNVPREATSAANACEAAKNQVLNAATDEEFERAERRMRLVCD